MLPMHVLRLVVHARSREPVLLLGEVEGDRCLPVFLRRLQADVISVGPRTAGGPEVVLDVLLPLLEGLGHRVDGVEIVALEDGIFRAEFVVDGGTRVPARPSDALAVAVRERLPIGVADEILDAVGQPVADLFPDGTDAPPEQQMQDFKRFIDEVEPGDFAP